MKTTFIPLAIFIFCLLVISVVGSTEQCGRQCFVDHCITPNKNNYVAQKKCVDETQAHVKCVLDTCKDEEYSEDCIKNKCSHDPEFLKFLHCVVACHDNKSEQLEETKKQLLSMQAQIQGEQVDYEDCLDDCEDALCNHHSSAIQQKKCRKLTKKHLTCANMSCNDEEDQNKQDECIKHKCSDDAGFIKYVHCIDKCDDKPSLKFEKTKKSNKSQTVKIEEETVAKKLSKIHDLSKRNNFHTNSQHTKPHN